MTRSVRSSNDSIEWVCRAETISREGAEAQRLLRRLPEDVPPNPRFARAGGHAIRQIQAAIGRTGCLYLQIA
ncbi:MAG: hypothetical protein DMF84_17220 [Acidobacteria bacterium]|nr:MAG: hypothetical protein DMF84_17220 [Acidobacteriota bacterium]